MFLSNRGKPSPFLFAFPLLILVFSVFQTTVLFSYEIILKNGSVVKGTLLRDTKDSVILKDSSGVIRNFKRSEIASTKADTEDIDRQNTPKSGRVATEAEIEALRKKYDLGLKSPEEFSWLPKEEQYEYFEKDSEFEEEVLQSGIPVLVEFWASWCGQPCRTMAPVMESIAADFAGEAKLYKVNVDIRQAVTRRYRIEVIPMFLIFRNGKVEDQIVGSDSKEAITKKLREQISRTKSYKN